MTDKEQKWAVRYWLDTAEHDHKTMLGLFRIKEYSNALFFGHVVLEKVLKGLFVKENKEQAPFTHDLVRLAKESNLNFSQKEIIFLKGVNKFNIRARYPEQKLAFYKKCTRKYTENNLQEIKKLYEKLCPQLKQQR